MSLTLITTVGGATSNSYVTEAEIASYMETKLYATDFLALTEEQQKAVAIECTRMLDTYFAYYGDITNTDPRQALQFPRSGAYECDGTAIDDAVIPQAVKNAQMEQMVYFASTNSNSPVYNKYNKVSVGKNAVAVEYNRDLSYKKVNSIVADMLVCLGRDINNATGDGIGNIRIVRS